MMAAPTLNAAPASSNGRINASMSLARARAGDAQLFWQNFDSFERLSKYAAVCVCVCFERRSARTHAAVYRPVRLLAQARIEGRERLDFQNHRTTEATRKEHAQSVHAWNMKNH